MSLLRSISLPALFTLAPFARIYAGNLDDDLAMAEICWYARVAVAAVCIGALILHLLLRPKTARLSAVYVAGVWAFFGYGEITGALANRGVGDSLQAVGWIAAVLASMGVAVVYGARAGFQRFLLLFAALTLALPAYTVVAHRAERDRAEPIREKIYPLAGNAFWSGTPVRRPDIYWIVADSYPGRAVLADDFDFDNRRFYRALEAFGFDIAHASHANYSKTLLSVSSTLEMAALYEVGPDAVIQNVHPSPGTSRRATERSRDTIAGNNRSVAYLRQLGYRYVHFEALTFQATRCRDFEDICLRAIPPRFSETKSVLLAATPLHLLDLAGGDEPDPAGDHDRRERSVSGTGIPELAQGLAGLPSDRPLFVYAHIYSPHGPHTNDAQCNPIPYRAMGRPEDFVNQLQCVNRHLLALVDQIVRDSPDAVVVINSDHGPRLSASKLQTIFDYSPAQIREHLSILNAIRIPTECRRYIEPDLTPINTQRLIFACLGGHAPRYEVDRHFITSPRRVQPIHRKIREVEIR